MQATEFLSHYDQATLWPNASGLDAGQAYQAALAVRERRIARGERPAGYKIGFTNRTIWPRYGVFAPIWGTVWDTTVQHCHGQGAVSLTGTCQPRIEPECAFGMTATPPPDASLDQLLQSIAWVAPSFEIVQSHQPGWKFTAPDTMADGALHARLLVGTRVDVATLPRDAKAFDDRLAEARVVLRRAGELVDQGVGANVLDGPLHALRHFLQELRACPGAPDLQAGDVISTGTWTDAWPVAPGETWSAEFDAVLGRLEVRFT